jgi:hypothetical protein
MSKDLKIEYVTKKDLTEAFYENTFWKQGKLTAISKNKAKWIADAKHIKDDDFCFVIALENDTVVSYLHILPDYLASANNKLEKIYWMFDWWTNKKYNSSIVSTYVFKEAISICNKRVVIKSYANNAEDFYKKQPFTPITRFERTTIFFGITPESLIHKMSFLRYFKFVLVIVNKILFSFITFFNSKKAKRHISHLKYEYLNSIDNRIWNFISTKCKSDLVFKSQEYINWQLNPNQYVNTPVSKKATLGSGKISGQTNAISIHSFTVNKDDKIVGFISFLNFNGEVHLKYFLYETNNFNEIAYALIENLCKIKANYIITDNKELATFIKEKFLKTFVFKANKTALVHDSILNNLSQDYRLKEQDGHFL